MEQNFLTTLPSEILFNILSRLPIPTIISCKSVCKPWLDMLESNDFVNFHLSKSPPGLAVLGSHVYEVEDRPDHYHYNPVADFNHAAFLRNPNSYTLFLKGSANGLILLRDCSCNKSDCLYICNPITREYIELRIPKDLVFSSVTYGFGVSKLSGQHKLVRISHEYIDKFNIDRRRITLPESECRVYTLGIQSWRSVASIPTLDYSSLTYGVFLNGNLNLLASDLEGRQRISCFDLETEEFSSFSSAPASGHLFALRDCLCMTDYSSDDELAFWMMKEYGVEKSWMKEFVISRFPEPCFEPCETVYPIKFFENGDVLMACEDYFFFYYSVKTKRTHQFGTPKQSCNTRADAIAYVPSFLSLKSLGMENVRSFR